MENNYVPNHQQVYIYIHMFNYSNYSTTVGWETALASNGTKPQHKWHRNALHHSTDMFKR
jgi:hypothetical protein